MTSPWQPPDSSTGTDPIRTTPQYGEMAPPGYVSPVPPPPVEVAPPTYYSAPPVTRKSHPADVAVTSVLLAFGLIGMLIGVGTTLNLHQSLASAAAKYGATYTDPANLGALAAFIAISHVVLYLAAVGISLPLLITRRVAFWVPLVAGAVAAIILWGSLIALIVSDHALMNAIQAGQ
jgi:hypothetical protein